MAKFSLVGLGVSVIGAFVASVVTRNGAWIMVVAVPATFWALRSRYSVGWSLMGSAMCSLSLLGLFLALR